MPTLRIDPKSPLHKRLIERVRTRHALAERSWSNQHDRWRKAEETTLAYLPESEKDAARRNLRESGKPQYTTIMLPYTYAVLMSAHTYWTSVFFARSPVHQFMGLHGEGEMQVQAVEALVNYQVEAGMLGPYYVWLYDAAKYGLGILGTYWDKEKIHYGQLVEMQGLDGKPQLMQATMEVEGYCGNRVFNCSPYDFMIDPRVSISNFQKGEFCFARKRMGWHDVIRRQDAGWFTNIEFLKEHVGADKGFSLGSSQLERPDFSINLNSDADKHPAGAIFWEGYYDLIPQEWGLGGTAYPQKWCITTTEDLELIVGASPLGNMHGKFPFDIIEPEIEGYAAYNRGVPEIMESIQQTMDWLINSHFYNVRAALNNQFIVDPSKLVIKDASKAGPGFVWRLRPEAYGTDITKMFAQIPVNDVTRGHFAELQNMMGMGERVLGVNDQIMGSLTGTQRKTATEVRTTTGFGVNRMKTVTEYASATAFSPHARKLVQNNQQLYDASMKLRIAGDLVQNAGMNFIDVSPEAIAGFYNLVQVDGSMPIDRLAQANLWKEMMGNLRMMPPQVAMSYDWTRIFAWVASLAGLKNINQFKIQLASPEALAQQADAGNVIPMPARPGALPPPRSPVEPGNAASTQTGLNALGGGSSAGPAGY